MIIWLSSYPKSGNTYIRSFLSAYFFTSNGVFDFEQKIFRDGIPEDYVSKCTNIEYIKIDMNNKDHMHYHL